MDQYVAAGGRQLRFEGRILGYSSFVVMQSNILRLQRRLFEQLNDDKSLPTESSNTVEQQRAVVEKSIKGK